MSLLDYEIAATEFVEEMNFDQLIAWCKLLGVAVEPPPADDMWPDWENELRTQLITAMMEVGE